MSVFLLHDTLSNFHVNKKPKYQHVYFANILEKKKNNNCIWETKTNMKI